MAAGFYLATVRSASLQGIAGDKCFARVKFDVGGRLFEVAWSGEQVERLVKVILGRKNKDSARKDLGKLEGRRCVVFVSGVPQMKSGPEEWTVTDVFSDAGVVTKD